MFETLLEALRTYFLRISVGVVILLAGFALGIIVKKFLSKFLREVELNKLMTKIAITQDVEKIVCVIVPSVIYLFTVLFFLDALGIQSYVLYIVVGSILTLLILMFLVGAKDLIPNLVAWIILQRQGKIKVGKHVDVKEIHGVVEKIGLLETEIKTPQGDHLYVPNALFLKSKFRIK